ncbi:hypothetical protein CMA01_19600 [Carnobacterium maltaromaticum]|nr:hypothetical protein CMA01_19600 [Carnobacterium maltaromaticum]
MKPIRTILSVPGNMPNANATGKNVAYTINMTSANNFKATKDKTTNEIVRLMTKIINVIPKRLPAF